MLQYGFNNSWVSQSMLYVYLVYCVVWKMLNSVYGYGLGFILDLNMYKLTN